MDMIAMHLRGIKALVFDKDGTLFDFTATWGRFARDYINGLSPDASLRARLADALGFDMASGTFHPSSIVIAATAKDVADHIAPLMSDLRPEEVIRQMNEQAARATQVPVVPLADFLKGLRAAGLSLGVATNDAESSAYAHLRQEGVADMFDFIAGFDSGHGSKPGPGQLLAFAKSVRVAPQACAMVGDSLHDLHAGRAAGMVTVGVLTGVAGRQDLAPAADIVLDSIADLPAALGHNALSLK